MHGSDECEAGRVATRAMGTKGNIPCILGRFGSFPPRSLRMGHPVIARIAAAATAAYTAVLVFATHYPKPQELLGPNAPSDKTLHVMAYTVLAGLVGLTLVAAGRWTGAAIVRATVGLAIFGALDEITQPLPWFRRAADPLDWVFDVGGIALGLTAVALAVAIWRSMDNRSA